MNAQRTIELLQRANTALKQKHLHSPAQLSVYRRTKRKAMKALANMIGPQQVKQLSLYAGNK
jgi:hypothetical protein